jgi:hypothetical protein
LAVAVPRPVDLFFDWAEDDFLEEDRVLEGDRRVFEEERVLEDDLDPEDLDRVCFFGGTLAPFLRASESPMAMACFRLRTVFPLRPLCSFPFFLFSIACLTDSCDFFPYRAMFSPPL